MAIREAETTTAPVLPKESAISEAPIMEKCICDTPRKKKTWFVEVRVIIEDILNTAVAIGHMNIAILLW